MVEQVDVSVVPRASRPDRKRYELTPVGRDALGRWLADPAEHSGGYRDDFVLKLHGCSTAGRDRAARRSPDVGGDRFGGSPRTVVVDGQGAGRERPVSPR